MSPPTRDPFPIALVDLLFLHVPGLCTRLFAFRRVGYEKK